MAASLVGFAGVAGAYFSGGQLPFFTRTPRPASLDGQQPGGERAEILRMVHQMADEIRDLKARVEAVHAQSTSAKEAAALEGLKARLDAEKTETGALAGKVDRLQREITTKLAKRERTVRPPEPPGRGPARRRYESPARRRLRSVPKSRRPGSASPAWKSRPGRKGSGADFLKRAQRTRLILRPRPRREATPISGGPMHCYGGFRFGGGSSILRDASNCCRKRAVLELTIRVKSGHLRRIRALYALRVGDFSSYGHLIRTTTTSAGRYFIKLVKFPLHVTAAFHQG